MKRRDAGAAVNNAPQNTDVTATQQADVVISQVYDFYGGKPATSKAFVWLAVAICLLALAWVNRQMFGWSLIMLSGSICGTLLEQWKWKYEAAWKVTTKAFLALVFLIAGIIFSLPTEQWQVVLSLLQH